MKKETRKREKKKKKKVPAPGMKEESESMNTGEETEKTDIKKEILSWVRMFVIAVVIVFVLTQFILINAQVPSASMETTIMTKDRLIGFRFAYWFSDPERGDIILFRYPLDESEIYIKRVIGCPGDRVEIRDGHIYLNGAEEPISEPYLHEEWIVQSDGLVYEVPEDSYFVMGDNRNNSSDGREWAMLALEEGLADTEEEAMQYSFVARDEIRAKAIFTYFPSVHLLK